MNNHAVSISNQFTNSWLHCWLFEASQIFFPLLKQTKCLPHFAWIYSQKVWNIWSAKNGIDLKGTFIQGGVGSQYNDNKVPVTRYFSNANRIRILTEASWLQRTLWHLVFQVYKVTWTSLGNVLNIDFIGRIKRSPSLCFSAMISSDQYNQEKLILSHMGTNQIEAAHLSHTKTIPCTPHIHT